MPTAPVAVTSIVSRKTHGAAGVCDIDLTPPATAIECRSGGVNGDYTVVFSFGNDLTSVASASVNSGTGSVASSSIGSLPNQYVVNLTGVANVQQLGLSLSNVQDNAGHLSPSVNATMNGLVGDITANRSVNSSDVGVAKTQAGNVTNAGTFRSDANANGDVNSRDIGRGQTNSAPARP